MDDYHSEAQVEPGETCRHLLESGRGFRFCKDTATVRIGGIPLCETHRERMLEWTGR